MRIKLSRNAGATDYWRFPWLRFPGEFVIGSTRESNGREYEAIMIKPGAKAQVYYPLEDEPGISRMFAGLSDASGALEFANRFGELGLQGVSRFHERYNSARTVTPYGEEIRDWLFEAGKLQRLYRVWDALKTENHSELRRIVRWQGSNSVMAVFGKTQIVIANNATSTNWLSVWPRGDLVGPAKLFLVEQYNESMYSMASPMLLLDFKGAMRPYNSPASLLGALWLEFGQLASGARKQLPCESCGRIMDVTGLRSDKRKHSNCVLREKMARYRSTKKETEGGETKTRKR